MQEEALSSGVSGAQLLESLHDLGLKDTTAIECSWLRGDVGPQYRSSYDPLRLPKEVWPLRAGILLFEHLPDSWRALLESVKVGMVSTEEENALATGSEIAILTGLSSFLVNCTYAAVPATVLVEAGAGDKLVPHAVKYVREIKNTFIKILVSPPKTIQETKDCWTKYINAHKALKELKEGFPRQKDLFLIYPEWITTNGVRFVFMHELCHIAMDHHSAIGEESLRQEREADRAATETIAEIYPLTNIDPYSVSFFMSALEFLERISGDYQAQGAHTHPSYSERREAILVGGSAALERSQQSDKDMRNLGHVLNYCHFMHVELSSILVENGFEPLNSFFTQKSDSVIQSGTVPVNFRGAPKAVRDVESGPWGDIELSGPEYVRR